MRLFILGFLFLSACSDHDVSACSSPVVEFLEWKGFGVQETLITQCGECTFLEIDGYSKLTCKEIVEPITSGN